MTEKKPNKLKRIAIILIASVVALAIVLEFLPEPQTDEMSSNSTAQTSSSNPYADIQPLLEQAQSEELKQVIQEMGDLWWLSKKRENRTDGRTDDVAYFSTTFTDAKYALFKKIDAIETTESTDIKQILMNMNDIVWQWWQASGNDTEETKDMSLKMDAYFPQYLHAQ